MSVVDTGWKSGPEVIRQAVADLATGSRTRRIVITHAHPDHVRGLADWPPGPAPTSWCTTAMPRGSTAVRRYSRIAGPDLSTVSRGEQQMSNANEMPHIDVFLSSWPRTRNRDGDTFAPVTSTLITGPTEAVLIDAQYLKADLPALLARIEESGKHLTTIYVTHAHADHYFGLAQLLQRFPDTRAVTVPAVAEEIRRGHARAIVEWDHLFGDAVVTDPDIFPEPLDSDVIEVDGHPLHLVTIGQADIAPSTVVHIPERNAVVAGDSIYNEVHPMLGLTGPAEWDQWVASIDKIAALRPTMIVAGHKKPNADDHAAHRMLDTTRRYIEDFRKAALSTADARELVAVMSAAYPDHANPWTLRFSARQWFSRATDNR